MKVLAISKIITTAQSYGETQQYETLQFDNVTNVAEVVDSELPNISRYVITHKTGDDLAPHNTSLSTSGYTILVS